MVSTPYLDCGFKMTTKRIFEIENYIGLSTDTKPTDSQVGAKFFEYDTKNKYVVYTKTAGVAVWTLDQ